MITLERQTEWYDEIRELMTPQDAADDLIVEEQRSRTGVGVTRDDRPTFGRRVGDCPVGGEARYDGTVVVAPVVRRPDGRLRRIWKRAVESRIPVRYVSVRIDCLERSLESTRHQLCSI